MIKKIKNMKGWRLMKKNSKIFAMVLAVLMIISIAGCGQPKTNDTPASNNQESASQASTVAQKEEPLKFVYHNFHLDKQPEPDNEMYKWLKENKNVDIQFESELAADKITDKMNLMLAGGDVPDVMSVENFTSVPQIAQKMGESGLVISVDEWIAKYPDLVKLSDAKYIDAVYRNKKDQKLYMIPVNNAAHPSIMKPDVGPVIREDWLAQVGMNAPKTPDELYEVLKAFRDKIPDVDGKKIIPATFDGFRQFIADAWTKSWFDLSDDKKSLTYQFMNPEVEEYMVFMNKLYNEKLLDAEFLTQQGEAYMAKLASGRVGYTVRIYWDMDKVNSTLKANNPKTRFIPSPFIRLPEKGFVPVTANPSYKAFSSLLISSKFAKEPGNIERLMEFLNWNASDEGLKWLRYGEVGKYYDKLDNGLMQIKPEFKEEYNAANNTFRQRTGLELYNIMEMYLLPNMEVDLRTEEAQMGYEIWKDTLAPMPLEYELTTPGKVEQQKWGAMWAELDAWTAKAVLAKSEEESRKAVSEMLKAYETNGGRDIVNERLQSIANFMANNK